MGNEVTGSAEGNAKQVNVALLSLDAVVGREAHLISELRGMLAPVIYNRPSTADPTAVCKPIEPDECDLAKNINAHVGYLKNQCQDLEDMLATIQIQ